MVQTTVERRSWSEIDWARNAVFVLFGFTYLGIIQWLLYVKWAKRMFKHMEHFCSLPLREKIRHGPGLRDMAALIALDFFVYQPVLYWPSFYVFKQVVSELGFDDTDDGISSSHPDGTSPPLISTSHDGAGEALLRILRGAFHRYRETWFQDNFGMCAFWLPLDLVIYSVPLHLRLPLNHAASFVWTAIVSFFRGGLDEDEEQQQLNGGEARESGPPS